MLYDTHSHLNFKAFADDYANVIKKSLSKGMFLNLVGSQYETSRRAVEIANEFKNDPVYAAVGLHPSHVGQNDIIHGWNYEKYKKLASDPKVAAIGETGIDYYRFTDIIASDLSVKAYRAKVKAKQSQKQIFLEHIKLAAELKKPLIIHCRPSANTFDAYIDLIKILKENSNYQLSIINYGVVHCFLADWQIAKQLLDLGLCISFTGIITYKNADDYLIEAIKKIPLNRVMIETDCPYLTPEPHRGQKRNEPLYVECVARKIAEIKGIDVKTVIDATTENGKKFFGIKK